jgi:hypothetical protein
MSPRRRLAAALDRLIDRFAARLLDRAQERLLHPHTLLLAEAQRDTADYIREHMMGALAIRRRSEVLRVALSRAPADGLVLEFGVAGGESIREIAAQVGTRIVHGFDSFEGLPADWPGRHEERGHYSTGGVLPAVPANVRLHKGLFDATLPAFLAAESGPAAFVHVDCDLYASARAVLAALAPRIVPGTVILFDEYFNFVGWRGHEFRAFQEFVAERRVRYRYLCWGYQQAAVIIEGVG